MIVLDEIKFPERDISKVHYEDVYGSLRYLTKQTQELFKGAEECQQKVTQ